MSTTSTARIAPSKKFVSLGATRLRAAAISALVRTGDYKAPGKRGMEKAFNTWKAWLRPTVSLGNPEAWGAPPQSSAWRIRRANRVARALAAKGLSVRVVRGERGYGYEDIMVIAQDAGGSHVRITIGQSGDTGNRGGAFVEAFAGRHPSGAADRRSR